MSFPVLYRLKFYVILSFVASVGSFFPPSACRFSFGAYSFFLSSPGFAPFGAAFFFSSNGALRLIFPTNIAIADIVVRIWKLFAIVQCRSLPLFCHHDVFHTWRRFLIHFIPASFFFAVLCVSAQFFSSTFMSIACRILCWCRDSDFLNFLFLFFFHYWSHYKLSSESNRFSTFFSLCTFFCNTLNLIQVSQYTLTSWNNPRNIQSIILFYVMCTQHIKSLLLNFFFLLKWKKMSRFACEIENSTNWNATFIWFSKPFHFLLFYNLYVLIKLIWTIYNRNERMKFF